MRDVIMWNLVTLDGYFEGPKSWDIDWHDYVWGEELERWAIERSRTTAMLLFGRVTYEGMASHWPSQKGEIADFMNGTPKVVFSRTLPKADWSNTRIVRGDAVEEVARLKRQPGGNLAIFGSATLCSTLMRHGLIDEYQLGIVPVILGQGNPLFRSLPERIRLELLEARPAKSGCVILRYRPAGSGASRGSLP